MDKVRAFFKVMYEQRFWVLSVVGVIIALVCWKLSASSLDAEFVTNKGAIDAKFNDMNAITSKNVHGNPDVNQKEREQVIVIRDNVLKLWQTMYDRQKEEVLQWPAGLGPDFLEAVADKRFRDPLTPRELQRYREYAKDRFPALVEMVQAKKMLSTDGAFGGAMGGRDGGGAAFTGLDDMSADQPMYDEEGNLIEPEHYLVQWLDQGKVRQELEFARLPTALQVWVTQENLWVYETLLRAINNTNETHEATRPDNAAIRAIVALEVGQPAALALQTRGLVILPAGGAMSAESAVGMDGGRDGGLGMGTDGGMGGGGDAALMMNRYIGPEGTPIADATTDPGGEYRMLPVRMELVMKQEAVPDILVECANAALPVEVKRVRVNPTASGAGFDSSLAVASDPSMASGGGMDGGRGRDDGGGRMGFDGGRGGDYSGAAAAVTGTGMATVEIHGIVYIYNPPDQTVLSVPGEETTEVAAADETTAALKRRGAKAARERASVRD